MTAIICLPVDWRVNSVGLPSLLAEEIDGAPVLYHTVNRLTLSNDYKVVLLFAEGPDAEGDVRRTREMLSGLEYEIHVSSAGDVPSRDFLRRGRLWSLASWRGGIGGTTYYDEAGAPAALVEAAEKFAADTVGLLTSDSPLADPHLASQLVAWHREHIRNARVTVTGVPPGLAPAFFNVEILKNLAQLNLTLAASVAYRPSAPQRDLAATEAHFESDIEIRTCPWRLTAHSARQLELLRALARLGASPRTAKSLDVVRALAANPEVAAGEIPAQLEIEPTTRTDAAPFCLREYVSSREVADMPLDAFGRIVSSLGPANDVVVSLEGLGEALLHPELAALVACAKKAGALGVHVGTNGRLLDDRSFQALSEARLDILSVMIGAWTDASYRALYGTGGIEAVRAAVEDAFRARAASRAAWPLIVTEITKMRQVEPEIEPFYDHWNTHSDWPVIRPYNDFAGQIGDHATIHMRTSSRIPCRKIFHELYIDASGAAWPCRQDIHRTHPLGNAAEEGAGALWRSEFMRGLRAAHAAGDYGFFPLCKDCKDWYYA